MTSKHSHAEWLSLVEVSAQRGLQVDEKLPMSDEGVTKADDSSNSQPDSGDAIPPAFLPIINNIASKLRFFDEATWISKLRQRDGAYRLASVLPERIPHLETASPTDSLLGWEQVGYYYKIQGRLHEAISIYNSLYSHMMLDQQEAGRQVHKGMPLVWMSDCYSGLGYRVHAKRYLMLTLCEDAIMHAGKIDYDGGPYFRLLWYYGLSHEAINRYTAKCWDFFEQKPDVARYPERVLTELDQEWMMEVPSIHEAPVFHCNRLYVRFLLSRLGSDGGRSLEFLAHYLMSLIPGCRAYLRRISRSTDYDVVGLLEGVAFDFRSELGRYFVCECKDWNKPANFTALAKFCRVLDSVKSRFGILFSKSGLSGSRRSADAEREQYKVFADRGIVIVVVSHSDLDRIAEGANFLSMLRLKYEQIRLDLKD